MPFPPLSYPTTAFFFVSYFCRTAQNSPPPGKRKIPQAIVAQGIHLVGLSGLDSNKYKAILRFKRSIANQPDLLSHKAIISDSSAYGNKIVDTFGETAVTHLSQPYKVEFSPDKVNAIITSYQDGISTYKLAEQYGCSKTTISNLLKAQGICVTNRKARAKLDAEVAIAMYEKMHTSEEIAKHFGVSPYSVLRCLREHGVKMRNRWDYMKD